MPVPYTFGTATASIPLSQLDSNFATAITIGNTAVQLGNTVTTLNNMTLANVTISSGNVTITNVSVTTANVSGTANVQTLAVTQNATVAGNATVTGNVSMNVATITTANVSGTANVSSLVVLTNETVLGNTSVTGNVTASAFTSTSSFGFKNRIINGAMVIDQRNAGASVNTAGSFAVDRWFMQRGGAAVFSLGQSTTVPAGAGFYNSIVATVTTAAAIGSGEYYDIQQNIEGLNLLDLNWGTANAATVTLSFWVRSSVAGIYSFQLRNSAVNRSIVYNYTITTANTWQQITQTIAGDTSGTWLATNGIGIGLVIPLGTGSSYTTATTGTWQAGNFNASTSALTTWQATLSNTFYITGVQLEKGSTATSFDYRPYGTELALCQRYYESTAFPDASFGIGATRIGVCLTTTAFSTGFNFLVPKRTNSPTVTLYSRNGNSGKVSLISTGADVSGTSTVSNLGGTGFWGVALGTSQTAGAGIETGWTASAEL